MGLLSADAELKQLGFVPGFLGLGMELLVGSTKLAAVEGPMLMISISSFGARSMCSYDVECPRTCSIQQIAGLIYMNMAMNFKADAEKFKSHIQSLGIPLFQ